MKTQVDKEKTGRGELLRDQELKEYLIAKIIELLNCAGNRELKMFLQFMKQIL